MCDHVIYWDFIALTIYNLAISYLLVLKYVLVKYVNRCFAPLLQDD